MQEIPARDSTKVLDIFLKLAVKALRGLRIATPPLTTVNRQAGQIQTL